MDAQTPESTDSTSCLPSRRMTDGPSRTPRRSPSPTTIRTPPANARAAVAQFVDVFKKPPCVAGLHPQGRDVAKDMIEVERSLFLTKSLADHGILLGKRPFVTGRTPVEYLQSVKRNPHRDVVRSPGKSTAILDGTVDVRGYFVPEGAVVKVTGMSDLEITGQERGFARETSAPKSVVGQASLAAAAAFDILNVKLTGRGRCERQTQFGPRATHHRVGASGSFARKVGPVVDRVVTRWGAAHEKQCYADI